MKSLWTVFALAMVMFVSCDNKIENAEEPIQGEEVTVKIGFDGEILDITEGPLETKAIYNDLFLIQVFQKQTNGSSEITRYAYGLFDSPDNIKVNLYSGFKYDFQATMIKDGKNVIGRDSEGYSFPLNTSLSNKMIYSSDESIDPSRTYTNLSNEVNNTNHPNIMRYYGQLQDFSISNNENLNINMFQVVFGAKFETENLTEGRLEIQIADSPKMILSYPNTHVEDIFTFSNFWENGTIVSEEILTVVINFINDEGKITPIYNGPIKYKRNKQTVAKINLDKLSELQDTKLSISIENTLIVTGETVTINPGDQVPSYN